MSTTESTGRYTSMLDGADQTIAPAAIDGAPHGNWRWFWLGLFLAALPLLIPYFLGLWANPTYRYFPFAIGAVAWLAYNRTDGRFYPPRGWISWAAIALGLALILFSAVLQFPWFSSVAFVIFATALLYSMRGPNDNTLLVLALPLFTLVQLVRADVLLVLYLQNITTWMSSVMLDLFAVPHAVANNVIQLSDRELFVAEACSGIQSVFTLSFLALLMVAWHRRRIWMAPLYLGIAFLLAVFANVIRVTVVALAANSYQIDLAEGWPHEILGYIALALAFAFLLSFDYLVATVLHQIPEETEFNPFVIAWNYCSLRPQAEMAGRNAQRSSANFDASEGQNSLFRLAQRGAGNRIAQIGFACVVGIVCVASLTAVIRSRKPVSLVFNDESLVFDPPRSLFNDSFASLSVIDHRSNRGYQEPRLGANSDIWECEWNDVAVQLVLSQPHRGWHELCDCYERLDWRLLDRDIFAPDDFETFEVNASAPDALSSTYVLGRFKRGPSQYAYLIFSGLGSDGTLLDAPGSFAAFTHRVWNRIDTTGVWDQSEVLMLQMWITAPEKLKPRQLRRMQEDFVSARATLADAIAANAGRELPSSPKNQAPSPSVSTYESDSNLADSNITDNVVSEVN